MTSKICISFYCGSVWEDPRFQKKCFEKFLPGQGSMMETIFHNMFILHGLLKTLSFMRSTIRIILRSSFGHETDCLHARNDYRERRAGGRNLLYESFAAVTLG